MNRRALVLAYGLLAYAAFLASFLYAIAFLGPGILPDALVPKTIDSGETGSLTTAVTVDLLLLALFALQHSGMARPAFKQWWTRLVPEPAERSTFVLLSSLLLFLLYWQWRPLPQEVWHVENAAGALVLRALFWLGWLIVLSGSFMIDHFELFGLKQVWFHWKGKEMPEIPFKAQMFYRYVRHPLMLGFLIAFWATPAMSVGHLLFAMATTGYILIALQLEERDLMRAHGEAYEGYRKRVPQLLPLPKR